MFSSEEISEARKLDLFTYLNNYYPDELVKVSRGTYTTKEHDSLKISNGKWYWFSKGIGGKSALDYLVNVKGYTFLQAVEEILRITKNIPPKEYKQEVFDKSKELVLPEKNDDNSKALLYLMSRGISSEVILKCIENDLIYEDTNHNVVFVGYDNNKKPRYASIRGTGTTRYMKEAYGSNKAFSFQLEANNNAESVHLFESAIDLLSYVTLCNINAKSLKNDHLLSLAGVYAPQKDVKNSKIPLALNLFLYTHPNIKKIYLHLDNDLAGRISTKALSTILSDKYEVIDSPPKLGKDYNDFLCMNLGLKKKEEKER